MDKMTEVIVQVREAGELLTLLQVKISSGNSDLSSRTEQQPPAWKTAAAWKELPSNG